jgi:ABC-type nitrate/sulfonate/bicarbonate transport system substrate-binding protein
MLISLQSGPSFGISSPDAIEAPAPRERSRKLSRMGWIGLPLLGFLAGTLTSIVGCTRSTSHLTIRVAGQPRTYEYIFMAGGFANRYGLDVAMNFLPSAAEPAQMLIAGQVDVAHVSPERLVPMVAREPGKYLIVGVTSYGSQRHALVVRGDSPYLTIEELRGKKIGASIGTGNWQVFQRYLATQHLSLSDFQTVNMSPEDMATALKTRVIDGMLAWEPYVTSAVIGGDRVLVRFANLGLLASDIVTTKRYAAANPGTLTRYLAAWYDAAEWWNRNSKEASRLAGEFESKRTGVTVDPMVHEATLKYVGTDPLYIANHLQDFYGDLQQIAEEDVKGQHLAVIPDFSGLVGLSYLEQAVEMAKTTPQ